MIRLYKDWKLENTFKLLDLAKSADYEYVCKKALAKHGYKIPDFEAMDKLKGDTEIDPYLQQIRQLWYILQSY